TPNVDDGRRRENLGAAGRQTRLPLCCLTRRGHTELVAPDLPPWCETFVDHDDAPVCFAPRNCRGYSGRAATDDRNADFTFAHLGTAVTTLIPERTRVIHARSS